MPLANPFSEQRCGVNWLSLPNVLSYDDDARRGGGSRLIAVTEARMSLQAPLFSIIPEQTVQVARAAFPKGNPYMLMHDTLGPIY